MVLIVAIVVTITVVAVAVIAMMRILPPRLRTLKKEDEKDAAKNLPQGRKEDILLLRLQGREGVHRHHVESQQSRETKTIDTVCLMRMSAQNRRLRREEIEDMNGAKAKKKKNEERQKWNKNQSGIRDGIT